MAGTRPQFDPTINYYQVLNVPYAASKADITRAYRSLIRHAHPDRAANELERGKSEERAKLLNAAYAVLSKPDLRQEYDQQLRQTAMSDALMQRYIGSAPGRPSPFMTHQPPSPQMVRARKRAGRSALLHLLLIAVIFVVAIVTVVLLLSLIGQGLHALVG